MQMQESLHSMEIPKLRRLENLGEGVTQLQHIQTDSDYLSPYNYCTKSKVVQLHGFNHLHFIPNCNKNMYLHTENKFFMYRHLTLVLKDFIIPVPVKGSFMLCCH